MSGLPWKALAKRLRRQLSCDYYTGPCGKHNTCVLHAKCSRCQDAGYDYVFSRHGVVFADDYREICRECGGQSAAFREEL